VKGKATFSGDLLRERKDLTSCLQHRRSSNDWWKRKEEAKTSANKTAGGGAILGQEGETAPGEGKEALKERGNRQVWGLGGLEGAIETEQQIQGHCERGSGRKPCLDAKVREGVWERKCLGGQKGI